MNKSTAPGIVSVVLLLTLLLFMPRNAANTAEFHTRVVLVFAIAVAVSLALRYGLPWLHSARRRGPPTWGARGGDESLPLKAVLSRSLSAGCLASLAITMLSVGLGMNHVLNGQSILYFDLGIQQLALVLVGYYVATCPPEEGEPFLRTLSLIVVAAMAVFFAWSSNIVLKSQRPPVLPRSSDLENMVYSVPAVLAALWGILRATRRRH